MSTLDLSGPIRVRVTRRDTGALVCQAVIGKRSPERMAARIADYRRGYRGVVRRELGIEAPLAISFSPERRPASPDLPAVA